LSGIDVLVIDDWAMAPLSEPERRDFWEICEDRYQVRSLILTSQLPVTRWHEQIGDPTVADGILDRLVHDAHRIEMRGDSMRKNRGKLNRKLFFVWRQQPNSIVVGQVNYAFRTYSHTVRKDRCLQRGPTVPIESGFLIPGYPGYSVDDSISRYLAYKPVCTVRYVDIAASVDR
jgi:hypothetical protein